MTKIAVVAMANIFDLRYGQPGEVDDADPEVVQALRLRFIVPIDDAEAARFAAENAPSSGCGCGK